MTFSINAVKKAVQRHESYAREEAYPAVKLYIPETRHAWLISELIFEERNLAWGLFSVHGCIITQGFIDLNELKNYEPYPSQRVQIDKHFRVKYPLRIYETASKLCMHVTDNDEELKQYL